MLDRISIRYFEGSNYWEILIDGKKLTDRNTKEEAEIFIAKVVLELS